MKNYRILWILVIMLILAGCGQGNDLPPLEESPVPSEDRPQNNAESIELTPLIPPSANSPTGGNAMPNSSDPVLVKLIETAIEDLAERLTLPTDQIELKEAAEVVWSDSSLGCPNPGSMYTQVLTPGYLIRLQSQGAIYEYHAGRTSRAFYCPNPIPPHEILQSE